VRAVLDCCTHHHWFLPKLSYTHTQLHSLLLLPASPSLSSFPLLSFLPFPSASQRQGDEVA
jgi:hypothetical protein